MAKQKVIRFKKGVVQDWVDAILWAFVVAMIIRNYTFQNFRIPTSSMERTLLVGDYLYANKMKYFFQEPKRGEIVTFRNPDDKIKADPNNRFIKITEPDNKRLISILPPIYWDVDTKFFTWWEKKNIVKRVIGVPGDTLWILNKQVYVNGEPYTIEQEQYLDKSIYPFEYMHCVWNNEVMGSRDNFKQVIVPEKNYFVLGDNRDNSLDSRFFGWLPLEDITGTPGMIFFSRDAIWGEIRKDRFLKVIK